jgi:hypothetical protein
MLLLLVNTQGCWYYVTGFVVSEVVGLYGVGWRCRGCACLFRFALMKEADSVVVDGFVILDE